MRWLPRAWVSMLVVGAFATSLAHAGESGTTVGVFRTGMTLDEVRAAAPRLAWKEGGAPGSRFSNGLNAPDAQVLAGQLYEISVSPGWYGDYLLQFRRQAREENAAACTKHFEALLTEAGARWGGFSATEERHDNTASFSWDRWPETAIRRIGGSSYAWHGAEAREEASAERTDGDTHILITAHYYVNSLLFGQSACHTRLAVEVKGHPPESATIAPESLRALVTPSIAVRHYSLEGVQLPPNGVTATGSCRIWRNTGMVGACELQPQPAPDVARAIGQRQEHMAFDTSNLDPGNPVPLFAQLQFRLDPRERLRVPVARAALPEDVVEWSGDLDVVHLPTITISPPRAGSAPGSDRIYGQVKVDCQIQRDGSLLCGDMNVSAQDGHALDDSTRAEFVREAQLGLMSRRAAPTLKNGAPSANAWVSLQLSLWVYAPATRERAGR